jgi:hypothetical protein
MRAQVCIVTFETCVCTLSTSSLSHPNLLHASVTTHKRARCVVFPFVDDSSSTPKGVLNNTLHFAWPQQQQQLFALIFNPTDNSLIQHDRLQNGEHSIMHTM